MLARRTMVRISQGDRRDLSPCIWKSLMVNTRDRASLFRFRSFVVELHRNSSSRRFTRGLASLTVPVRFCPKLNYDFSFSEALIDLRVGFNRLLKGSGSGYVGRSELVLFEHRRQTVWDIAAGYRAGMATSWKVSPGVHHYGPVPDDRLTACLMNVPFWYSRKAASKAKSECG